MHHNISVNVILITLFNFVTQKCASLLDSDGKIIPIKFRNGRFLVVTLTPHEQLLEIFTPCCPPSSPSCIFFTAEEITNLSSLDSSVLKSIKLAIHRSLHYYVDNFKIK